MENELDLSRYSAALRRRRRLIVVAAVVGAVAGLVVGLSAPLVANRSLVPVDRSAELDSAGIEPLTVDVGPILTSIASTLSSDQFDNGLEADTSVGAQAIVSDDSPSIALTVSAGSADAVARTIDVVKTVATKQYVDGMRLRLDGVGQNYEEGLASLTSQLESVEAQLAAVSPAQTTLAEGLLVLAENLRADIAKQTNRTVALQRLSAALDGDLRVLDGADPGRSRSPAMMAALGGLGAAILVSGVVALLAAFDRRIRTRRDLERLGLGDLLGVVSRRRTDSELDVLAGALRQAAASMGTSVVQTVPVSSASRVPLAESLSDRLGTTDVMARDLLDVSADETMRTANESLNVLMVAWGKDGRTTTTSVANRLAAASGSPIGVVLVEVPVAEIASVEQ